MTRRVRQTLSPIYFANYTGTEMLAYLGCGWCQVRPFQLYSRVSTRMRCRILGKPSNPRGNKKQTRKTGKIRICTEKPLYELTVLLLPGLLTPLSRATVKSAITRMISNTRDCTKISNFSVSPGEKRCYRRNFTIGTIYYECSQWSQMLKRQQPSWAAITVISPGKLV